MRKITVVSNILCAVMIAAYTAYLAVSWQKIPASVPSHFDALGRPDAYGSKAVLIVEPVLALLLWGLFAIVRKFPNAWNFPVRVTKENRERLYAIGNRMMDLLMPLVVFLMLYAGASSLVKLPVAVFYLALAAMGADIVVSIVLMVKAR